MKYNIDEYEFNIIIERKNNKNTYLKIKDSNTVLITTNYFTTKKQIIDLINNNEKFIITNLEKMKKKEEKDDKFFLLGKEYNIIILPNSDVHIMGNNIYTPDLKKLDKWLNKEMKELYIKRLEYCYNLFEEVIPYPTLRIRKMKTRWGVCNRKNHTVTLNSELLKYDITKLDYVIVHELSHFIHLIIVRVFGY